MADNNNENKSNSLEPSYSAVTTTTTTTKTNHTHNIHSPGFKKLFFPQNIDNVLKALMLGCNFHNFRLVVGCECAFSNVVSLHFLLALDEQFLGNNMHNTEALSA